MPEEIQEQKKNPEPGDAEQPGDEEQPSPLRSIHTTGFADLIGQLGISLIVTTYQAGFLIVLRHDGTSLNTHFRRCTRPMGLAASGNRLAVGVQRQILQYRNMVEAAAGIEAPRAHDACYLPRETHLTGDIDIHEMAWGVSHEAEACADELEHSELWLINTRFCCLCTIDRDHCFVPHWRPPFVSGLSPQDRCHLNGLGMIDGRPRYVTALGATDEAAGWRENKARGGVLVDVQSNDLICEGLSMPHSPRWHQEQLWLAESGDGSIGIVDRTSGRYEAVAKLDGFTRGLDFVGPYAFVGISQVRESAIFSGIPITERIEERICGVSAVDLRTGREIGYIRFEDAVQEIFSVQVARHAFPEIVETEDPLLSKSYAIPRESLDDVRWVPAAEIESTEETPPDQGE